MDAVLTRFPFWESDTGTITLNQGSGFILTIHMVGQCRAGAAVPEGGVAFHDPLLPPRQAFSPLSVSRFAPDSSPPRGEPSVSPFFGPRLVVRQSPRPFGQGLVIF